MLSPAGEGKIGFSAFSAGKTHPLPSLSKKTHVIGNIGEPFSKVTYSVIPAKAGIQN